MYFSIVFGFGLGCTPSRTATFECGAVAGATSVRKAEITWQPQGNFVACGATRGWATETDVHQREMAK